MGKSKNSTNIGEDRNAKVLGILQSLSACTDNYMYLMDFPNEKVWLFGGFEEDFDLGEKQPDGSFMFNQLIGALHPNDRPILATDMAQLMQGAKTTHNLTYRVRGRDGRYVWFNCKGEVEQDNEGRPATMIGCISVIEAHLMFDSLTGLFNQEQLLRDIKQVLTEKLPGFLIFMGIDNMKNINTIQGRLGGDRILQTMAQYLMDMEGDTPVYRMSGDVFAILKRSATEEDLRKSFKELQKRVADQFTISGGAVRIDAPYMDVNTLIQYSEFALREAKRAGKNTLTIFDMDAYQTKKMSVSLLKDLEKSVKNGCKGFSLVYHAQVSSDRCEPMGAEALLRYCSPTQGNVYPDEFIPILERSGLIYPVGLWVMRTALAQCREWRKYMPHFNISVNMSYAQLSQPEIVQDVLKALDDSGLPGEALTIEVTESMQLQDYNYYNTVFSVWQKRGIAISVDDFGTGFSSLGYLKFLNVDEIKIDRCFVSGIHANSYNYALLKNIIQLFNSAQFRICCEGVEEVEEYYTLSKMHSMLLQGYLFSRPCDSENFERQFFIKDAPEYRQYLSKVQPSRMEMDPKLLERYHQNVLHSVGMGLWLMRIADDGKSYELYIDKTMREMFGTPESLTPAELFNHWRERISAEYAPYVEAAIKKAIESDQVFRVQYMWNHPTRGLIPVGGNCARLEFVGEERCLQGCHWLVNDTPYLRKDAENEDEMRIKELEKQCNALTETNKNLKEMSLIYRTALSLTDHVITYIDIPNRTLHHVYHETTYDNVGGTMPNVPDAVLESGIIPPEDQPIFRQFYDDVYSGKPEGKSGLFRTNEGDRRGWVQMLYKTLFDENGKPDKAVVFSDDVTARVTAERRYEEYRQTVVSSASSFWEVNLTHNTIITEDNTFDDALLGQSKFEKYTDIISTAIASVEREYREMVSAHFNIDALIRAYSCGKREFSLEYPMRNTQGEQVWLNTTVYLLSNARSELCAIICTNDISEERSHLLERNKQAVHDSLTHLLNRRGIEEALSRRLDEKNGGWEGIFLIADVDDFKVVNDKYGHPVGDIILQRIASAMVKCFRNGDLISRFGGDEFVILIDGKMDGALLEARLIDLKRMLRGVSLPDGSVIDVGLSIGATRVRLHDKFEDMYHRADQCMYDVKRHGKNNFRIN